MTRSFSFAVVALASIATAQVPYLLGDLNTHGAGASVRALSVAGNSVHFMASTPLLGLEPYSASATATATLVSDFSPGSANTAFTASQTLSPTLSLFSNGTQLYSFDQTTPTPGLLMYTGNALSPLITLSPASGSGGVGLWVNGTGPGPFVLGPYAIIRSNGTAGGTFPLTATTFSSVGGAARFNSTPTNGVIITNADELWSTAGAQIIDFSPGTGQANPANLVSGNTLIYFNTQAGIYRTDGSPGGTAQIVASAGALQGATLGDVLLFSNYSAASGYELWRSAGTVGTTSQLIDLNPGATGSNPRNFQATAGGFVYFVATTATNPNELFRTDGTAVGTVALGNLGPVGTAMVHLNHVGTARPLYLIRSPTSTVWSLLMVLPAGIYTLATWDNTTTPSMLEGVGSTNVFIIADSATAGLELFSADTVALSIHLVADLQPGTAPSNPRQFSSNTSGTLSYFSTDFGVYVTDGGLPTRATARGPYDPALAFNQVIGVLDTGAVSIAWDAGTGMELYLAAPLQAPQLLADITPGTGNTFFSGRGRLGPNLYFSASKPTSGSSVWKSDGTPGGTSMFVDPEPSVPGNVHSVTTIGNRVFFTAFTTAHGSEPWVTDGTVAGTHEVADALAGTGSSNATNYLPFKNGALFTTSNFGLWFTDGTAAGTTRVSNPNPYYPPCALLGGEVAFFTDLTTTYRTTGVGSSPVSVSTGLTAIGGPTCLGDRAFFFARNGSNVIAPYVIDETASAPTQLTGTIPLAYDFTTYAAGTVMYFSANFAPGFGRELYKLDGNTITLVSDLAPGATASAATDFGRMKGRLLFSAAGNGFDFEPWALAIDPTPPVITPLITGTLGTNGWYTSNVAVSFTVTEPDSRLVTRGCQAQAVTTDTAGITFHCYALSEGDQADVVVTIKRDTVVPAAPTVTAPVSGSSVGSRPPVSGTAAEAGTVEVRQGATLLCSAVVTAPGAFSCQPAAALADGPVTLTVTEVDDAGNRSAAVTTTITVDTLAPSAPTLALPPEGGVVRTNTFSGTGEAGTTVSVFVDGSLTPVCTAVVDVSGSWACTPSVALADGAHTAAVSAQDAAGNTSPSTGRMWTLDSVAPAAPSITSPTSGQLLATATPRVVGRGEVGATVTVTFDQSASSTCTAVVDANADWACTPTTPLATGAHAAAAVAVDAAGNASPPSATVTFSLDGSTPPTPVLTSPAEGALLATVRPTFVGTAVAGQLIRVLVDVSTTPVCTVAVSAGGGWQCASSISLAQGLHGVVAIATNSVGTDSAPTLSVGFTIDSVAPAAPVVTRPASGSTVTLRPLFEGTAEAGAAVQVLLDGQSTATCTVTATATGGFSCSAMTDLSEGTHSVQAIAADVAGNSSAPSGTVVFNVTASIDTRAPEVTCPADISVEGGRTGSASVNFTATVVDNTDLTPALHYSQVPGSDFLVGETVVTVTATDAAMNSSSCSFRVTVTEPQGGTAGRGCGCGSAPDGLLLVGALFLAVRRRRQGR